MTGRRCATSTAAGVDVPSTVAATSPSSGRDNSGTNQQWNVNTDGTVTGVQSGLCLTPDGAGTANGTLLVLSTCNGSNSQKWTRS